MAEDKDALKKKAREMARDGKTITTISKELGVSWSEVAGYTISWLGAKRRITFRLERLTAEADQSKREKLAKEADNYVDFLYDAAKGLRSQVESARKALNR